MMKLYLISQDNNTKYDSYDSAVVAAENEEAARNINPEGDYPGGSWCKPEFVKVVLIGMAVEGTKAGIILGSYNAG